MGKREVALDDFLKSIQTSLGFIKQYQHHSTPLRKLHTTTSRLKNSKVHHENPRATAYLSKYLFHSKYTNIMKTDQIKTCKPKYNLPFFHKS